MAVDSARMSRLKALAVYALALEIAWLPGQVWLGSLVEVTNVHSVPSRSTTVPHILVPPNSPPTHPVPDTAPATQFPPPRLVGTPTLVAALLRKTFRGASVGR